jgi:hypothetical protein
MDTCHDIEFVDGFSTQCRLIHNNDNDNDNITIMVKVLLVIMMIVIMIITTVIINLIWY